MTVDRSTTTTAMVRAAQKSTIGGSGIGPVVAPMDTNPVTQSGADPVGNPAVHHSTAARAVVPTPKVMISGCTSKRRERNPLRAPMLAVRPTVRMMTTTEGSPSSKASAATTLATPTRKGMDRSMPPMTMTSVWPTEASPTKEASTSTARTVRTLAKPSMRNAPITNRARPSTRGMAIESRKRRAARVIVAVLMLASRPPR